MMDDVAGGLGSGAAEMVMNFETGEMEGEVHLCPVLINRIH